MNSQIKNLPSVAMVGASIFLKQEIDCDASFGNYVQLAVVENSNSINMKGFLCPSIDAAKTDEANIIESETGVSEQAELKTIFNGLAKNWREATGGYSLVMRRYAHSSYQKILSLQPKKEVVSLILKEIQQRPDRWFEALKILTDENPARDSKTFEEGINAWINWGKSKGLIS